MRWSSPQLPVVERKPLVLKASEFQHLFEEGPTEKVYANTPVSGLSQAQQGKILQEWARKVLQEKNPGTVISDPDPGRCWNGIKRGVHRAEYDFLMGRRRVEIKSSRMAWSSTAGCWYGHFVCVKLPSGERTESVFDDLYLVLLSPRGLHLIRHDLVTALSTRGKLTEIGGHAIRVCGSAGTGCWDDALNDMLDKLCKQGHCTVVDEGHFSQLDVKELLKNAISPGQAVVAGLPMSSMSREKRGKRIQEIGLAIDRRLHPQSKFSFMKGSCGTANAPVDWVRGKLRVELKSCSLSFNTSNNRWNAYFSCIKPDLFDELWLAIYGVAGVHFYVSKSPQLLQLSNAGAATAQRGHVLVFCGPRCALDPLETFKVIEAKMLSRGCELVAILEWEKGASVADDATLSLGDKADGRKGGHRGCHSMVSLSSRAFEHPQHDTSQLIASWDRASELKNPDFRTARAHAAAP